MDTEESIYDHFARKMQGTYPYLRDARLDGEEFPSRAKRALLEGLQRMDAVPRDDPYWWRMNQQPTFPKLGRFNDLLRQQDPCDEQALWCQIACKVQSSSGRLSTEEWRQLHRCGKLKVHWLIHAAYYLAATQHEYASSRSCLSQDLTLLLREEGLCAEAEPVLLALASDVPHPASLIDPPILPADWAARVLHGLQDPERWRGISEIDTFTDQFWTIAADLVSLSDLTIEELASAAMRTGYTRAVSGAPSDEQQAAFAEFLERVIRPAADFDFDPEEAHLTLLWGSLAYGLLLGLRDCGTLDDDSFYVGEEYLASGMFSEPMYLPGQREA